MASKLNKTCSTFLYLMCFIWITKAHSSFKLPCQSQLGLRHEAFSQAVEFNISVSDGEAEHIRLNGPKAWRPLHVNDSYVQVNLTQPVLLAGLQVQGDPLLAGRVTGWSLETALDCINYKTQNYTVDFLNPAQAVTVPAKSLEFVACLRVKPTHFKGKIPAMRLELLGCVIAKSDHCVRQVQRKSEEWREGGCRQLNFDHEIILAWIKVQLKLDSYGYTGEVAIFYSRSCADWKLYEDMNMNIVSFISADEKYRWVTMELDTPVRAKCIRVMPPLATTLEDVDINPCSAWTTTSSLQEMSSDVKLNFFQKEVSLQDLPNYQKDSPNVGADVQPPVKDTTQSSEDNNKLDSDSSHSDKTSQNSTTGCQPLTPTASDTPASSTMTTALLTTEATTTTASPLSSSKTETTTDFPGNETRNAEDVQQSDHVNDNAILSNNIDEAVDNTSVSENKGNSKLVINYEMSTLTDNTSLINDDLNGSENPGFSAQTHDKHANSETVGVNEITTANNNDNHSDTSISQSSNADTSTSKSSNDDTSTSKSSNDDASVSKSSRVNDDTSTSKSSNDDTSISNSSNDDTSTSNSSNDDTSTSKSSRVNDDNSTSKSSNVNDDTSISNSSNDDTSTSKSSNDDTSTSKSSNVNADTSISQSRNLNESAKTANISTETRNGVDFDESANNSSETNASNINNEASNFTGIVNILGAPSETHNSHLMPGTTTEEILDLNETIKQVDNSTDNNQAIDKKELMDTDNVSTQTTDLNESTMNSPETWNNDSDSKQTVEQINPGESGTPETREPVGENRSLKDSSEPQCGLKKRTKGVRKRRVINGQRSLPGEWPWLVSLHFLPPIEFTRVSGYKHACGASLLAPEWIVTAAHCFSDDVIPGLGNTSSWRVYAGLHDLARENPADEVFVQEKFIQAIYINPDYNSSGEFFLHDLALVKLSEPVQLNERAWPVCIDDTDLYYGANHCYIAGWGKVSKDGPGGRYPHWAGMTTIPNDACRDQYGRLPDSHPAKPYVHIKPPLLCASVGPNDEDSCQGDSGGPMMCERDGHWYLVGIVAAGFECGHKETPGLYTRVAYHADWIKNTLRLQLGTDSSA